MGIFSDIYKWYNYCVVELESFEKEIKEEALRNVMQEKN